MLGGWVNIEYSLFCSHVPAAVSGTWWIWSCTIPRFLWVSMSQSPCDSDSSALYLSTDTWAFCPYRSAVSICSTYNFLSCSFQALQWHWPKWRALCMGEHCLNWILDVGCWVWFCFQFYYADNIVFKTTFRWHMLSLMLFWSHKHSAKSIQMCGEGDVLLLASYGLYCSFTAI